jgi:hypothetical protein
MCGELVIAKYRDHVASLGLLCEMEQSHVERSSA